MKENSELRAEARQALKGNWGVAALFMFVYILIAMAVSSAFSLPLGNTTAGEGVSLVAVLLLLPLQWGCYVAYMRLFRNEELQMGWMFEGYSQGRIWTTCILQMVYTLLWTLLLIIPGIIKSYSYAMTPYILKDDSELSNNAAIERSMQMMQGNKMKLFLLDLSFIGWMFLAMFTFGIGMLWVSSYMYTARAAFYEDLKQNNQ